MKQEKDGGCHGNKKMAAGGGGVRPGRVLQVCQNTTHVFLCSSKTPFEHMVRSGTNSYAFSKTPYLGPGAPELLLLSALEELRSAARIGDGMIGAATNSSKLRSSGSATRRLVTLVPSSAGAFCSALELDCPVSAEAPAAHNFFAAEAFGGRPRPRFGHAALQRLVVVVAVVAQVALGIPIEEAGLKGGNLPVARNLLGVLRMKRGFGMGL